MSFFATRRGAVVAVLALAGLAAVAAWLEPAPPPISGSARASDGDSFRLGEERIRLLGLDAPELAQVCKTEGGDDWPCGKAARDRLGALLRTAPVDCQPEDTDRYGRLLAHCSVVGEDLGRVLVSEGLAVSSGDYWREEADAKGRGLGIWQGGFERPRDWRDDHPRGAGLLGWGLGPL